MDPYSFYLLDLDWDAHSEKLLDPDPRDLDGECVEKSRAVDPHLFFADLDPDPAVFLNADPDPAAFKLRIRIPL